MSFENIIGQEKVIKILNSQIITNRMPHSYIFIGPEGVGKKKTALELAKILNCHNRKNSSDSVESCDKCVPCKKINKGLHPDIHVVDFIWQARVLDEPLPRSGKNVIKIDTIRIIQKEINLKPFEGYYKVFIIDSAEKITSESANCLLKTLEEPPGNSLIILLTTTLETLPYTIISRCQQIKFKPLRENIMIHYLNNVQGLSELEAKKIVNFSDGSLGKAILLKETSNELYGINTVSRLWNNFKKNKIDSIELIEFSRNLSRSRDNVEQFIRSLLNLARNDLIVNPIFFHHIVEFILDCKASLRYNINLNIFVTFMLLKLRKLFLNA